MDSRSSSLLNYTKNRKLTNITFHLLTLCNLCCTFSHLYLTSNNSSVLKLVCSFTPYHLSLRVKAGKNCCFSKWYCHPFQVKQTYTDNGDVAWLYYCGWSDLVASNENAIAIVVFFAKLVSSKYKVQRIIKVYKFSKHTSRYESICK